MATNVVLYPREGELFEKFLKRFMKKCKKQEVLKEWYEKNYYFKSKSQKRREKTRRNKFLQSKSS